MVKRLIIVVIALVITLGGCEPKEAVVPALVEPVGNDIDTAVVSRGDIFDLTTYDAKVYPEIQEVSFVIDGRLKELYVSLGQEVNKGDLLLSLEDEARRDELKRLNEEFKAITENSDLENEKIVIDLKIKELELAKKIKESAPILEIAKLEGELEKSKLKQEQNLALQQFQLQQIQRKIEEITSELEKYVLKAPCSGRITYIKQSGRDQNINAYETMMILADEQKLHIQSDFISGGDLTSASKLYALIHGKEYAIEYKPFDTSEIIKMNNSGNKIESSYEFEAEKEVKAGDYACVCLVKKQKMDVLMIPVNALYSDSEGDFVYRIVDEEMVRENVTIGTRTELQVEIIEGLKEGDVVYVQK